MILLVDGNPLVHRAAHQYAGLHTSSGAPSGCVFGGLDNLVRGVRTLSPKSLCVVWDWGRSRWRHELFPGYKASRAKTPAKPPPVTRASFEAQRWIVQRILQAAGVLQVAVEGVEADDLLGVLATGLARTQPDDVVLFAQDHDLHQLLRPKVHQYDAVQKAWVHVEEIEERYGIRPELLTLYMALSGAGGDDIPKVAGIGPHKARQALGIAPSIDGLWSELGKPRAKSAGAWMDRLATPESRATVELALQLVTIPTAESHPQLTLAELAQLRACLAQPLVPDRMTFSGLLTQWELVRVGKDLDELVYGHPAPDFSGVVW